MSWQQYLALTLKDTIYLQQALSDIITATDPEEGPPMRPKQNRRGF